MLSSGACSKDDMERYILSQYKDSTFSVFNLLPISQLDYYLDFNQSIFFEAISRCHPEPVEG